MVEPIFQDAELQAQFESQGYVKIPFLSEAEVANLVDLFWKLHPTLDTKGFQSSSYSNDYAYKRNASDLITAVFKPHYEKIFKNYRAFGSAYLYKQPDTYSELPVHQDWTIVDEEKYVALNIWVPLIDVSSFNGALYVMPGSHYGVLKTLRCPTLPMFFDGYEQLMIANSIPMEVKAGEAVVLNQSIVHYSPPNKSDKIRIAITSGVMSAAPKMNFHYCPDRSNNEVEVLEMEDDFLISFENFYEAILKRPLMGKSLGMKPYTIPLLTESELKDALLKMKDRAGLPKVLATPSSTNNNNEPTEQTIIIEPQRDEPSIFQRIASFFQTR